MNYDGPLLYVPSQNSQICELPALVEAKRLPIVTVVTVVTGSFPHRRCRLSRLSRLSQARSSITAADCHGCHGCHSLISPSPLSIVTVVTVVTASFPQNRPPRARPLRDSSLFSPTRSTLHSPPRIPFGAPRSTFSVAATPRCAAACPDF